MAPIHAAAQAGQRACLEYMVKGASVSVRSRADDGATPAHFAAASGQVSSCKELAIPSCIHFLSKKK